jgi:hypothetical protein
MPTGHGFATPLAADLVGPTQVVIEYLDGVTEHGADPTVEFLPAAAFTLVVGAFLLLALPEFVDSTAEGVRTEPLTSFWWGVKTLFVAAAAVFLLLLSVVGWALLLPFAIVLALLDVVGSLVALFAVVDGLVESQWIALGFATLGLFLVSLLTGLVGAAVGFAIGATGMGAVVRCALDGSPADR